MELVIVACVLYFVPTAVALLRGLKTPQGPILLNIFLGWTVLGWVAALIWAACAPVKTLADGSAIPADQGAMYRLGRAIGSMRSTQDRS